MVRKLMTAALILTLGLALTACGNETAGTAANRWTGTNAASQEWAIQRQSDARGPLEDRGNGAYHADETGRVDGYHTDSADEMCIRDRPETAQSTVPTAPRSIASSSSFPPLSSRQIFLSPGAVKRCTF